MALSLVVGKNMKTSHKIIILLMLIAGITEAQVFNSKLPPYLRYIPLYIERPLQPTDSFNSTIVTVVTIGTPSDPYYSVRTDTRSTNVWITADKVLYHSSLTEIVDDTTLTVGTPGDVIYVIQNDVFTTIWEQEHIVFPNRTYVIADLKSYSTNGVMIDNTFKAIRYSYGFKIGTPLTKSQYERLIAWLGID